MVWLLLVYLFLPDGSAIVDKYPHAANSYEDCKALGWKKAKALHDEKGRGTYSFLCIDTSKFPGAK